MAVEIGEYLLVPWHEFELLREPGRLRGLIRDHLRCDDEDEVERFVAESGLGNGDVVAVRRHRRPSAGSGTARARETPMRELPPALPKAVPTRPAAEPVARSVALEFSVVTSDGRPVADTALVITLAEKDFEHEARTDVDGKLVLVVPDEGAYDVRFESPPPRLPPPPDEPPTSLEAPALPRDCTHFAAATGSPRRVVLRRPAVTEVLIDGYAQGAKVMRWGGMRPRVDGTVATTRGALRLALWHARGRTLCVAGHTDPVGQDTDNDALSLARARSVQLYAAGDLDSWAEHAATHSTELDLSCALVACNRIMGFDPITLEDERALAHARAQMRTRAELGDQATDVEDWRAIADLYDLDLAAFLRSDLAGLAELRSTIRWVDPPVHGLGERYPRPDQELADLAGSPAVPQRRCSLLIFGPEDGAAEAAKGHLTEVYDGSYTRTILPVPGEVLVQIAVGNPERDPIARARAWIGVGPLGIAEHHADLDGTVRIMTFAGDRIRVAAAFDADGSGTMMSSGVEGRI